jgi:tRNA(Ile)-lysidine synthase
MAYRNRRGYLRPLLDISRADIERYLIARSLGWREDASNSDTAYLRNRIRHRLLPLLEEYNPAVRSSLAATASLLGDDETLLDELTEQAFAGSCRMEGGRVACSAGQLRELSPALRRRVLRSAFEQLTGTLAGVGLRHVDALCDLINSARPNARLALPQGVAAVREYDRLLLLRADAEIRDASFELLISGPGRYDLPHGGSIAVDASGTAAPFSTDPGTACFDLGSMPFPWLVRTFRPGDRITPFGMSGRKKVKDIFIDRKIPALERKRIPLLFCGDELVWVAGVCVSESCRIDTPSDAVVRVAWRE